MAEEIEKRIQSLEAGFHIVANQVVGKIEEVHRDVRELGRESRDTFREIRDIRQDMRASFGQASQELLRIEGKIDGIGEQVDAIQASMATKADLAASEERILAAFKDLVALLTKQGE